MNLTITRSSVCSLFSSTKGEKKGKTKMIVTMNVY